MGNGKIYHVTFKGKYREGRCIVNCSSIEEARRLAAAEIHRLGLPINEATITDIQQLDLAGGVALVLEAGN